jgi:hypothetical protein
MLGGQVRAVAEQLPEAARKVSAKAHQHARRRPGTLEKVQAAAREIEKATNQATGAPPRPSRAPPWWSSRRDSGSAASCGRTRWPWPHSRARRDGAFLSFFLLLSGDAFKRKLVRSRPVARSRSITLQVLDDINVVDPELHVHAARDQYAARRPELGRFHLIGLENAGAWALAAGLLHFIPYAGPWSLRRPSASRPSCSSDVLAWCC